MLRSDTRRAPRRASAPHRLNTRRLLAIRSLLTALAEIDHAYEADLETVRASDAPEQIKENVLKTLQQRHQEHRAPYIRQLHVLQQLSLLTS